MKKVLYVVFLFLLITGAAFADEGDTELELHIEAAHNKISNGEKLYDENVYPGSFEVSYIGVDEESNGPVFHVQFVSNEFYSSGRDFINRFDVTSYIDGMSNSYQITNDESQIISEKTDESNNVWKTISIDYHAVFRNLENEPIDSTYSFALTRLSQHGYIMFAINVIDYDVVYDPDSKESDPEFTEIDENSEDTNKQNDRRKRIYQLIATLAGIGGASLLLLRRKKKIKLKRKKPVKVIAEKPSLFQKVATVIKKTANMAVKGLKKVSTTISDTYTTIKSIGINTRFGRLEIGDVIGLTGADKVATVVNTISDLCDVINKNKDINSVWRKFVDRFVNKKIGKLRSLFAKGLKINPKIFNKLNNINKEFNTIIGIMKDGVSADELLQIKEKLSSYKQGSTHVEKINKSLEEKYKMADKGIKIEGENFKKVLNGRNKSCNLK